MILASHGIIASQILSTDPDWLAYYNRVVTAGGSLSTTEQNATKTLVADLKSAGIWSAMKAIYPMVGASAAACAQNLKSASFTGTFTSGWTFASTGATPNGSSAYMDTGFIPTSNGLAYNENHISLYSRTNISGATYDIGSAGNILSTQLYTLFLRRTGDNAAYDTGAFPTNRAAFTNTNSQGFYLGNSNSTNAQYWKNGISQITITPSSSSISNVSAYVGGMNEANVNKFYSTREVAFASFGLSLTNTQASNFYTAVQAFQTTLSRNV
jgi:hypothetical protein